MIVCVRPEGLHKNVDVGKDQRFDIRSSRSLERFRSTPGKVPPDAFEIGRRKRVCDVCRGSARTIFNPSSISEVKVLPFSAACLFALRNNSSESRIVVRICQSIFARHIYVK